MSDPKRAKARRYYIVTDRDGDIWTAYDTRAKATRHVESCAALCGIIEVAPVPRVSVRGDEVFVNGTPVFVGTVNQTQQLARDLRRALKGAP